jgi:hypothetical protein
MRFFTREWHRGQVPEAEAEARPEAYARHLKALGASLPAQAAELGSQTSLHDARVLGVDYDRSAQHLALCLRIGDQQTGYADLDLSYSGAVVDPASLDVLRSARRPAEVELLYDEFDAAGASAEHMFLFWPTGEATIRFRDLAWTKTSRPSRDS